MVIAYENKIIQPNRQKIMPLKDNDTYEWINFTPNNNFGLSLKLQLKSRILRHPQQSLSAAAFPANRNSVSAKKC